MVTIDKTRHNLLEERLNTRKVFLTLGTMKYWKKLQK